jgi:hypothetical protein
MKEARDGRSPSTLRRDERILRPVLAAVGSIPLHALRTDDVRRALAELAASRSTATVALAHNCLVRGRSGPPQLLPKRGGSMRRGSSRLPGRGLACCTSRVLAETASSSWASQAR